MTLPSRLSLRIHLVDIPTWCEGPLVVGLQRGRDGLDQGRETADGVVFDLDVGLKPGRDGRPDFTGPLVHGRPGERFIYLCWCTGQDGHPTMFRRLKLYLGPLSRAHWSQPGITWADVGQGPLGVRISARGPDDTPACGTAPAPWHPVDAALPEIPD